MRTRRIAIAVMLAALLAASATAQDVAPASPPPAADPAAAERDCARGLAAKRDFAGAIDVLRQAQKKYGASAGVLLDEGWIYFQRASYERASGLDDTLVRALLADAVIHARKTLAIDPESRSAALLLAQALQADSDDEGARAAFGAWIEKHPKDPQMRNAFGDLLFAARDWSGADLQYTRCLEADPANGMARLNQTEARQWLGIAREDLEKGYLEAARLLPELDRPLRLLVNLHAKDRAKKLEALDKVVAQNPGAAWARVWIAYILRKEEPADPKRAFEVLRDAEKAAPGNPTVHVNLAEMLEELGDSPAAVDEYTLAVETGGEGEMTGASNALDRLLNVAPGNQKLPLAVRERAYDAICSKNPAEGSYGNNAGFWFRDFGKDYEKSLKYYLTSVAARPDDQDFLNDTALIYLFHLTDRKDLCLPMFEKVVRLVEKERQEPIRGYWDALENLCKYWFEKGDYEKTLAYANQRINAKATLNGRPYPSMPALQWKHRAEQELAKSRK